MEPRSKTTCSASSEITGASETKSVVALARGGFSTFCI